MRTIAFALVAAPLVMFLVAYVGYPLFLVALSAVNRRSLRRPDRTARPEITITVPVYNAPTSIVETLESILESTYPAEKRHILVISDASTDETDEVVRGYANRGVDLVRLPHRRGKTAAENAASAVARGELVINVDATVRLRPASLEALVSAFDDPAVGVASGRDVSVGDRKAGTARGESGYVGFEMWLRSLETRLGSIVGASGCFFGIRRSLYDSKFPEELSRDFASALIAREHGLRAVSVHDALCEVPRTSSLRSEFRRKTRTMVRGLQTLWYKRHLMNPFRYGMFAVMLIGHKLCRWLVYPLLPGAAVGLILLSFESRVAAAALAVAVVALLLGMAGLLWRGERPPAPLAVPGFILAANLAGILAWKRALLRQRSPIWEPTQRPA